MEPNNQNQFTQLGQWNISKSNELNELIDIFIKLKKKQQFIGLIGPMGVGKTYFTRHLFTKLNLKQQNQHFQSPSFALHQRYENDLICMDHLDLYRLQNEEELESIGFWDLFQQNEALIVVEWADRLNFNEIPKRFNPLFLKFELGSGDPNLRHCVLYQLKF